MENNAYIENYTKDFQNLLRFARNYIKDAQLAEDFVQEAYIRALKKHIFEDHPNPSGWLCKAVHYDILNFYRKVHEESIFKEDLPLEYPNLLDLEFRTILKSLLTEEEFYLIHRVYLDGYTEMELARQLGISYGAVRMRISRIKKKIKKSYFVLLMIMAAWSV